MSNQVGDNPASDWKVTHFAQFQEELFPDIELKWPTNK